MLHQTERYQHSTSEPLLKKTFAILLGSVLTAYLMGMVLPWPITLLHAVWLQGLLAALASYYLFHLPVWWAAIHLLFFPGLLSAIVTLNLPAYWYLAGFITLMLFFGRIHHTRVPLFLSSREAVSTLAELLPKDCRFKLVDLGSGCGGLICKLARMLPHGRYHGIETAVLPCWISKLRALLSGQNCRFEWESIWQHDLSGYDVVYAYLSPVPMPRLWEKARREMHPGSLFISNTFAVPGVMPDRCIRLHDFSGAVLYIWQMP
ncbi:class I SAM-dependent methyltransferase [Nitrosomonas sp.]|uniref:class I SAM-dependent methyltransferase n=1 Tax=Nitrosomonas sp. TaxID=42353 RepID=UPI0025E5E1A7|nr:class I SAM-dependent methyltransferase [Nitrosomonas sp.]MCC6916544.1 hypothetical protein [Nitrosomonas sp.]